MQTRRLRESSCRSGPHTSRISCVAARSSPAGAPGTPAPGTRAASGAARRPARGSRAAPGRRCTRRTAAAGLRLVPRTLRRSAARTPRQQLRRAEGLGDVVVGAGIERRHLLLLHACAPTAPRSAPATRRARGGSPQVRRRPGSPRSTSSRSGLWLRASISAARRGLRLDDSDSPRASSSTRSTLRMRGLVLDRPAPGASPGSRRRAPPWAA